MKKTKLKGYVYDFSTDQSAIDVDNIKDIHKYVICNQQLIKCKSIRICINEKSRI